MFSPYAICLPLGSQCEDVKVKHVFFREYRERGLGGGCMMVQQLRVAEWIDTREEKNGRREFRVSCVHNRQPTQHTEGLFLSCK